MVHIMKFLSISVLTITSLTMPTIAQATTYSYELSEQQTWADGGSSSNTSESVTVRSYVPGSNSVTYKNVILYTPTYTSEANASGDVVGSVYNVYGSGTTAFSDPHDGPKRTVVYPALQILHTSLFAINNDRLAIGTYHVLGGHAAGKGFIYDVIYDQYTPLVAPNTTWTDLGDINNSGQIVGTSINGNGAIRKGFTYDCQNGFEAFDIPGSSWTIPKKIDDEGNIYGIVSGLADATYFIARPDYVDSNPACSLVPREDVADPIVFAGGASFELSGDYAHGVRIADFDGRGVNDIFAYHEPGKWILYLGEDNFEEKIKYYGDAYKAVLEGIDIATEWDFNNDGFIDGVKYNATGNSLFIAKDDSSYYYVPQKLPAGSRFGDLNGDGLVDYVTITGAYATIAYQAGYSVVEPAPVTETDPVVEPDPAVEPDPVITGDVPAIDPNADKVESEDSIEEIRESSVLLSSGKVLWFNSETIIKFNDASGFEPGQSLEFKAWVNPDGALIGIKVEVV